GMILVVGPTGSGKSTTLSSALTSVRSEKTNIITIEDPVEYQIPGVNQTQINEKIKLTFAGALRSILRQDPDVSLGGEIREGDASAIPFYKAVGCDQCNHTGYRGRVGIYEVMRVTDKLRRLIASRGSEDQIRDAAVTAGMITLGEDGLAKVKQGTTTAEELL